MAEPQEVALIVAYLAAGFPEIQVTQATVAAYAEDLGDIPVEHLRAAAKQARQTARFFPRIAEIREIADDLWRQSIQASRERILCLPIPAADPNDPVVLDAKAKLRKLGVRIGA